MPPDDDALILDIVVAARKTVQFTAGLAYDGLLSDEPMQLALVKLPEIIGEAANHLSRQRREAIPEILWSDVILMRHILVHDYNRIDREVVWTTVVRDVPHLLSVLAPARDQLDGDAGGVESAGHDECRPR